MRTKRLLTILSAVFIVSALTAAEKQPQTKEEITRQAMRANKKAVVAHNMNLTPDQESVFWPMYDDYQIDINKLNSDREALVKKFAVNYNSMTDELAKEIMDQELNLEKKQNDLREMLISNFGKKFPPKVVARYYQIENKIDAAIMADAAGQIPLMK